MKNDKILSYQKKIEKKLFFKYLLLANTPGVYALINEKDKKVFIQSAAYLMLHINQVAMQLSNKTHHIKDLKRDRKKLQIKILEQCENKLKNVEKRKWMEYYTSQGYTLYNTERMAGYTIFQYITPKFHIEIQLITKGKRILPVKTFKSQAEADEFLRLHSVVDLLRIVVNKEQ